MGGQFPRNLDWSQIYSFQFTECFYKNENGKRVPSTWNRKMKLSGNKTRGHVSSSFITHSLFCSHSLFSRFDRVLNTCYPSFSQVSPRQTPSGRVQTVLLREVPGSHSHPDVSLARAKEGGKECLAYRVKVTWHQKSWNIFSLCNQEFI